MGFPVYKPEEEKPSAFWRALDYLDRFSSGSMGSLVALSGGEGDVVGNYAKGFSGDKQYSGRDVLAEWGMDPERFRTKALGLAFDMLNPLDPLNYVGGFGQLTKGGKAAKLTSKLDDVADVAKAAKGAKAAKLASDWGDAAKLGQRGLLTFAGHRIPIPGDATVLRGIQKTGQAIGGSGFGKAMSRLFGGRKGVEALDPDFWAAGPGKVAKDFQEHGRTLTNEFYSVIRPEMETLQKLTRKQRSSLLELAQLRNRGTLGPAEAAAEATKRGLDDAWDALKRIRDKEIPFTKVLEKTGMAAWDDTASEVGHMPRVIVGEKLDVPHADVDLSWKPASELENSLVNHALNQGSTMELTYGVDDNGVWETVRKLNSTLDPNEIVGMPSPYRYSEDIVKVLNNRIAQNVANINANDLVEHLKAHGIAVDWDDTKHLVPLDPATGKPTGPALWKKINQGRFAANPVALPVEYEKAFERYLKEVVNPENNYMMLGALGTELQSWWKSLALFSAPSAYITRNVASGISKNYMEGLTPFSINTARYYRDAVSTIHKFVRNKNNLNVVGDITLPQSGVRLSIKRLLQEYFARDIGGGGGFIGQEVLEKSAKGEIIEGLAGALRTARTNNRWFRYSFSANEKAEMFLRLPLALKVLDDTLVAAGKIGKKLPDAIDALDDMAGAIGGFGDIGDLARVGFENATEIVHRTHFDYDDLSKFEKSAWLRGGLVPFYAWMRKNIPHEITNMLQQPGKYMPFARAYYNAWQTSGTKPEEAPFWLMEDFAIPTSKDAKGRQSYLNMTNYLPMMDVVTAINAFKPGGTDPRRDYVERTSRWVAGQLSPFAKAPFEQGLSRDFFSGRDLNETPAEAMGVQLPGGARSLHVANLIPAFGTLDRLNPSIPGLAPEGAWTKMGNLLGTFKGDKRPHRNEAPGNQRWLRFLTGLTQYTPDPDAYNMSLKARKRRYKEYVNKAKRAEKEGLMGESRYYYELASKYRVK